MQNSIVLHAICAGTGPPVLSIPAEPERRIPANRERRARTFQHPDDTYRASIGSTHLRARRAEIRSRRRRSVAADMTAQLVRDAGRRAGALIVESTRAAVEQQGGNALSKGARSVGKGFKRLFGR